jgi:hypothetical protein
MRVCIGFGMSGWMYVVGGGFITLLLICMCCTACICSYKKMTSPKTGYNRDGSFDSTHSTLSR